MIYELVVLAVVAVTILTIHRRRVQRRERELRWAETVQRIKEKQR